MNGKKSSLVVDSSNYFSAVNNSRGIAYKIIDEEIPAFKRPLMCGQVNISFLPLLNYSGSNFYDVAALLGFSNNDIVSEIRDFYPNGKTGTWDESPIVPLMRRGVGSFMLERVIKDSTSNGSKLIYVETGKDSMRNFLRKKKFYEFCGEKSFMSYFLKEL